MPLCAIRRLASSLIKINCIRSTTTAISFKVAGPTKYCPHAAGRPIIFQAGASDDGKISRAPRRCHFYSSGLAGRGAGIFYRDVKANSPHISAVRTNCISSRASASSSEMTPRTLERQYQTTAALVSIEDALNYLGRYFEHHDFSQYPLDEPFPDIGDLGQTASAAPPTD